MKIHLLITDQSKRQILWEKTGFLDSGFVKTYDELITGMDNFLRKFGPLDTLAYFTFHRQAC